MQRSNLWIGSFSSHFASKRVYFLLKYSTSTQIKTALRKSGHWRFAPCKGIQEWESKTLLDSGFHPVDSGFQLLDSRSISVELDSGFELLVGFRIPTPVFRIPKAKITKIPDFKCKNFSDSEIRIPLHGARRLHLYFPRALFWEIEYWFNKVVVRYQNFERWKWSISSF